MKLIHFPKVISKSSDKDLDNELADLLRRSRNQSMIKMVTFLSAAIGIIALSLYLSITLQGLILNFFMR